MIKGQDYIGIAVIPFLHDGQGRYLLGMRTDKCRDEHFTWENIGGGGVKFGETIETALRREVEEEVGTKPFNIEFLGTREVFGENEGKKTHWVTYDYRVQVDPKEVRIAEPDKCSELKWCRINELPSPLQSKLSSYIDKYRDRF
jgi:ADP-ribose pyrophosphatase YjhB (NUDIX family)